MMGGVNDFSFLGGSAGGIDLSMFDSGKKGANGFATGNGTGGLTTIAANPMYMSFGDPAMDPMAWASFGPGDYVSGGAGRSPVSVFSVNPFDTTTGAGNSQLDINGMFGIPSSFGSTFATNNGIPSTDDMYTGVGGVTPSFLDFNSRTSPGTSVVGSTSGGTFSDVGSSVNVDDKGIAHAHQEGEHGDGCPRTVEDVRKIQAAAGPPSTFGKPTSPNGSSSVALKSLPLGNKASSSSTSLSSASSVSAPVTPPQSSSVLQASSSTTSLSSANPNRLENKDLEKDHACAHARMAALCADLPRTTKKPNQIEIGRAWEKIRQIPSFEVGFVHPLPILHLC